jgi:hypothetical protein
MIFKEMGYFGGRGSELGWSFAPILGAADRAPQMAIARLGWISARS